MYMVVGKGTRTAHGFASKFIDVLCEKDESHHPVEELYLDIRNEKINIGTFKHGEKKFYFVIAEI
jgi:hypothetical protein